MSSASTSISQLLNIAATVYGVIAALTVLLQARQMLSRRLSCEVSGRFLASYAGGYLIWLLYGLSVGSMPLIVVDVVGLFCGGVTLAIALSLRGSIFRPKTWTSCDIHTSPRVGTALDLETDSTCGQRQLELSRRDPG